MIEQSMETTKFEEDAKAKREEKARAFKLIIIKRQAELEKVLQGLVKATKATCEVLLTKDRLTVLVTMPAYWTDVAKLDCWFSNAKLIISYGAGGCNDGFDTVEVARQKADALLLLCELVTAIEKMDWKKFTGLRKITK